VGVDGKTVSAVLDAMQRINVLLGAITLTTWANSSLGWWCSITHGSGGGVISDIDAGEVGAVVANISRLPKTVRRKLDAALYWTRIGRPSTMGSTEDGTLRAFVSYWNAFECLVDVVHLLRPR